MREWETSGVVPLIARDDYVLCITLLRCLTSQFNGVSGKGNVGMLACLICLSGQKCTGEWYKEEYKSSLPHALAILAQCSDRIYHNTCRFSSLLGLSEGESIALSSYMGSLGSTDRCAGLNTGPSTSVALGKAEPGPLLPSLPETVFQAPDLQLLKVLG